MQQPSLAQYLINWLEQDLTQQYGTQWENIPDDESQYLYIPNKENPRTVIRLADHLCSLYEFTKHIKEEQNVLFKSIVFKEINYAGNTNGLWDAEGQEIVFENVDEVYEHYYDVLPKIENDIIKVINDGGDYTDSTGMADVHPIKVTNIVRKDGKVKLSWDGTGEDPLIKYKKEHNIKESKTNKNMKKNIVKINENTLRQIVAESVKKVLKENQMAYANDAEFARIINAAIEAIGNKLYDNYGGYSEPNFEENWDENYYYRYKVLKYANDALNALIEHQDSDY